MAKTSKKKTSTRKTKKRIVKPKTKKRVVKSKTKTEASIFDTKKIPASVKKIGYSRKKLNLLLGYLTFFVVLFVLSLIFHSVSLSEFNISLFFILSLISGVFLATLLIVLLIYIFLRVLSK